MKQFNLKDTAKSSGFEVPEDYFKTLPTEIQARAVQPAGRSRFSLSWGSPVYRLALPALLLFALFVGWQAGSERKPLADPALEQLAELSLQEIHSYLAEEAEELSVAELGQVAEEVGGEWELGSPKLTLDEGVLEELELEDLEEML